VLCVYLEVENKNSRWLTLHLIRRAASPPPVCCRLGLAVAKETLHINPAFKSRSGIYLCVCVCDGLTSLAVRALVSFGLTVLAVRCSVGFGSGAGATAVFLFHWGRVSDGALVAVVI